LEKDLSPETESPNDNHNNQDQDEIFEVFTGIIELILEKDLEI